MQTAEGELRIEIPQAREAAMPFASKLFPKWHCKRLLRTDPLKALIIGGFVRGRSMRDVESLCKEAGLGKTSKSTVLVSVRLGMREANEDWLELGRDLIARGLAAPRLVVADGTPGLISAIEEI